MTDHLSVDEDRDVEYLENADAVADATRDPMLRWGSQSLAAGYPHRRGFAIRHRTGVAVYAPQLNQRDRLLLGGEAEDLATVIRAALADADAEPRLLADTDTTHQVVELLPELELRNTFGVMALDTIESTVDTCRARWLTAEDDQAVDALLNKANPDSYIRPDDPGSRRWAGVSTSDGEIVAVAADCWPAPRVGFIAGVATHPDHRGAGLSTSVCGFLRDALHAEHGEVALMVHGDNAVAIGLYRGLGFDYRSVTAAKPV